MIRFKREKRNVSFRYRGSDPVTYSIDYGTYDQYGNKTTIGNKTTAVFDKTQRIDFDELTVGGLYWFVGTFVDENAQVVETLNYDVRTLGAINITNFEPVQEYDYVKLNVATSIPTQAIAIVDNARVAFVDTNELSNRTILINNLQAGVPYEVRVIFKTSNFKLQEVVYTLPARKYKEVLMENKVYKYMNMAVDMWASDYDSNSEEDYARGIAEYLRKFREALLYAYATGQMPDITEIHMTLFVDIVVGLAVVCRGDSLVLTKMIANWFKYDNTERLGPGLPKFTNNQKIQLLTVISNVVKQTVFEFKVKEISERIELLNDMGVISDSSPFRPFYQGITGNVLSPSGAFDVPSAVDNEIVSFDLFRTIGEEALDQSYDLISPRLFLPPSGGIPPSGV